MATQKRQASVLGSTLTSLTLNSDLSSSLSEEETSEGDDEDCEDLQEGKRSGESAVDATDNETETGGKDKEIHEKDGKKPEKLSKPRVRMKTLTIDGQLVYFCLLCDKIFTRRKDKINHELAHSSEMVLTCTECGKEYFHESSLAYHMRSHDADQLYLCDLCPKMFAQGHHLKTHILSHSHPTEFTCKTCHQDFALASDLSEHIRKRIKEEMTVHWCKMCKVYFCRSHSDSKDINNLHAHQCTACNELFFSHKKLRLHMKKFAHKSIDKPKALEPLAAEEIFSQKSSKRKDDWNAITKMTASGSNGDGILKNKRSIENNDENSKQFPKRRRLASKSFVSETILSSSSLQDSAPDIKPDINSLKSPLKRKGKPYCKKCNKSFKDISELDTHKLLAHGETPKLFACDICHQRFPSQSSHDSHKAQHKKEEMHTCPICSQDFFLGVDLTKHLKEHSGDFPYKCNQCGKAFRLKLQLIQHIRLHIPQTPLACDKCGLQMSCHKDLDEHLLSAHAHEETDEFKCHLCNKIFHFRYKLQNHLRLHTNAKTFQCYVCHKSFVAKHFLQHHLQIHLQRGVDVNVAKIIKTETEEETVAKERMCEDIDVGHKTSQDEKVCFKDDTFLSLGDVKDNGLKKVRSATNLLKLNFQKVPEDNSSDSEESGCSVLTRESEKSDPFRFSSDGSDCVKFSMAKERRRMRKKRQLSRLALYNKLNALKNKEMEIEDKQIKSLNESNEAYQENCDTVQDLTVEINGVCSQADNEVTLYVNLQTLKPLSSRDLLSISTQNIDSTDKENRLPRSLNMEQLQKACTKIENFHDTGDMFSATHDNGQTLVLDIEMDDEAMNKFLTQKKLMSIDEQNSDQLESNSFNLANDMTDASSDFKNKLAPRSIQLENFSLSSHQRMEKLPLRNSSTTMHESSRYPSNRDGDIGSDLSTSRQSKSQIRLSGTDSKVAMKGDQSIQPLQSLRLMTAQIESPKNRSRSKFKKAENAAFIEGRDKCEELNKDAMSHDSSPNKFVIQQSPLPSPNASGSSALNSPKDCKPSSSLSTKSPIIIKTINKDAHINKSTSVVQSGTRMVKSGNYDYASHSESVNPQSQFHAFSSSFNSDSKSENLKSLSSDKLKKEVQLPHSRAACSSTSSKSTSSQPKLNSSSAKLSLPHSKQSIQTIAKVSRTLEVNPKAFQPTVTTTASYITIPLSIPASASSHTHVSKFSSVNNLSSDSKVLSVSSSEFRMPLKPAPAYSSKQSDNPDPGSINNSQIFDPQNSSLRDMNMLDLIGPIHGTGSGNVSLPPAAPVFTAPSISINALPDNQNVNTGTFYRPLTPCTILPTQLGHSSSNVFPDCSNPNSNIPFPGMANNILLRNDISCPGLPMNNSDFSLMSNLNLNFNLSNQGPNFGPSTIGPPLHLDLGLTNMPGIRSIGNFENVNNATNLGMPAPSFPLPVANLGVGLGGLDIMPINNINQNPSPLVNIDARGNVPTMRPMTMTMTNFDSANLLPFGGAGIQHGFNPGSSGIPSLNIATNSATGALLPQAAGSIGLPMMNSNNLMPNFPNAHHGTVNLPLGMSVVPDSGLLLPTPMGILGPMNPGPFLPM